MGCPFCGADRNSLVAGIERSTDKITRLESRIEELEKAIREQTDFLDEISKEPFLNDQCGCGAPVINDVCADADKHTSFLVQRLAQARLALWELRSMAIKGG